MTHLFAFKSRPNQVTIEMTSVHKDIPQDSRECDVINYQVGFPFVEMILTKFMFSKCRILLFN